MRRFFWIFLGCVALNSAQAASFDCAKASTKIEKMICGNADLSKLDEDLNKAYLKALGRDDVGQEAIKSQRQWLKDERNVCVDVECVKKAYEPRIKMGFTSIHREITVEPGKGVIGICQYVPKVNGEGDLNARYALEPVAHLHDLLMNGKEVGGLAEETQYRLCGRRQDHIPN